MSSTFWLVAAVTLVYLGVSVGEFKRGNPQEGVLTLGYCVANTGLLWRIAS